MSCPTCHHTMHRLSNFNLADAAYWWCPRCGTMTSSGAGQVQPGVPLLVAKCRHIQDMVGDLKPDGPLAVLWHQIDIPAAIHPPGDRK